MTAGIKDLDAVESSARGLIRTVTVCLFIENTKEVDVGEHKSA